MTFEIAAVLIIATSAVLLFVTERFPVDQVAMTIMAALLLSGLVTPEEGIAGFSNSATVTVGGMFVLSAALARTGVLRAVGARLAGVLEKSFWAGLTAMMLAVAVLSAFINNTAAIAIFMPMVLAAARQAGHSPSLLLIPLSFASIFGGVCTLIGTSTNILVSSIAERHGLPAFTMFEFAPLGVPLTAVGIAYMLTVGVRLLPSRPGSGDLTERFEMGEYLADIKLDETAKSVGSTIEESALVQELGLDVLEVRRGGSRAALPGGSAPLRAGDVLRVRCDAAKIQALKQRKGVVLRAAAGWHDHDLESDEAVLIEAVVAPNSSLEGKTVAQARLRPRYGAAVLAIRHRGDLLHRNLGQTRLRPGDALLLEARRDTLERLQASRAFVVVSELGLPDFRPSKLVPAVLILGGVVAAAATGAVPVVSAAVSGAVLMVATGCLSPEEAYEAIEWKVIFLLAGVLTLGAAMEKTGAAALLSGWMVAAVGPWGPWALLAAFYVASSYLTEAMSNNATAAMLAPIAIQAAASMGVDPKPFLMAVTFAASASFMTPVGYQTNTMVYGPGGYRFRDFFKVGFPLDLLFLAMSSFLIPRIWPF